MKLSPNWFTEGLIDFELKQYHLHAWLQEVKTHFDQTLLYPSLAELIFHHQNLSVFINSAGKLSEQFPQTFAGFDPVTLKPKYEPAPIHDEAIESVREIVEYALPQIEKGIREGKSIFDFIEERIEIEPVGLVPLYRNAGYFLLRAGTASPVKAYEYEISVIWESGENFRQIRTREVPIEHGDAFSTFEAQKRWLIRSYPSLPNPATWVIQAKMPFPAEESLLPVAKRKFFRFLTEK